MIFYKTFFQIINLKTGRVINLEICIFKLVTTFSPDCFEDIKCESREFATEINCLPPPKLSLHNMWL